MNNGKECFTLSNGYQIPCIGYGTWQTPDGDTAVMAVREAIKAGYRHIDAAACYKNEKSVGIGIHKGLADANISREELFVTSKVWNTERGYGKTKEAFKKTCADLGLDYLDLYLIHWPASSHQYREWEKINLETWRAMTELYQSGKIKAIGVSNFMPHHLEALMKTEIAPMINQIEFHPGLMQKETVRYCKENNIMVEAWSPLGTGRMLVNPVLKELAGKYGKSTAQLCIKWVLQNDALPLPKSVTPARIKENLDVFDFAISQEDMETINALPNFGGSGLHPDEVIF